MKQDTTASTKTRFSTEDKLDMLQKSIVRFKLGINNESTEAATHDPLAKYLGLTNNTNTMSR